MSAVVQKLTGSDSAQVACHLRELSPEDRTLRFGAPANDTTIERYVASIDFARDAVFGLYEPEARLIGAAHLALRSETTAAELGLSVASPQRGRGYGYALLFFAARHAARLGFRRLYMHFLAENRSIIHLARKAGMTVVRQHAEAEAHLALAPWREEEQKARRGFSLLEWLAIMRGGWLGSR